MRLYGHKDRRAFFLTTYCLVLCVLSGCTVLGPRSISMGRADYNEVINRTEDEQMLLSIVKGRYGETSTLLAVNGVAANVRFSTSAGIEAAFGPRDISGDNLLLGGFAYEENPTITYTPVQGEHYIRQMMTPIPLDILLLAVRAMTSEEPLFTLLVNRINDLRNPNFIDPSGKADSRFMRFVQLFTEMRNADILDLVRDPREEVAFNVVISGYAPQHLQKVIEFLSLLDLPVPAEEPEDIVIPAYFALKTRKVRGIGITTRSTFDLIEIFRASVEVPQEHEHVGLSVDFPPMGLPGQGIRIISSSEKPEHISVAVKYRGYWFYIAENDQRTKAFFRTLRTFWSMTISGSVDQAAAPVLTIPVSH